MNLVEFHVRRPGEERSTASRAPLSTFLATIPAFYKFLAVPPPAVVREIVQSGRSAEPLVGEFEWTAFEVSETDYADCRAEFLRRGFLDEDWAAEESHSSWVEAVAGTAARRVAVEKWNRKRWIAHGYWTLLQVVKAVSIGGIAPSYEVARQMEEAVGDYRWGPLNLTPEQYSVIEGWLKREGLEVWAGPERTPDEWAQAVMRRPRRERGAR